MWREYGKKLITQIKYVMELIKRFNMSECKPMSTPLEWNINLNSDDETKKMNASLY